jgi:spore coat protein CotF
MQREEIVKICQEISSELSQIMFDLSDKRMKGNVTTIEIFLIMTLFTSFSLNSIKEYVPEMNKITQEGLFRDYINFLNKGLTLTLPATLNQSDQKH